MARWLIVSLTLISACASGSPEQGGYTATNLDHRLVNQGGLGLNYEWRGARDSDIQIATAAVEMEKPLGGLNAAPKDAPAPPPLETQRQADRQVIYNGSLMIQVAEPERVEREILALAKEMGGWIQKLDGPRITLRVQASKFDAAFERIAALGQVLDRKVTGTDVTDQFRDLKLRLENAEKLRVRFAALLEQAKNVQDALAVEKELGRVTEEIERLKGAIAQMQDQIAYSSVTVELRRLMSHRGREPNLPFRWVRHLGIGDLFQFEN